MKPDGVATAALESMETLEPNPMTEAAPPMGEEPNPAASPMEDILGQQPADESGQGEPQPEPAKETPVTKTGTKASDDPKAKAGTKAPAKTKPGATGPSKTGPASRPNTAQSRLTNGVSKPQTNGLAKKTTTGITDKKSTPTTTAAKKPAGAAAPKAPTKLGEKKPLAASRPSTAPATNGVRSAAGSAASKRTVSGPANGAKTSTSTTAAKKPPAPKPASAAPTKASSAAAPKPDRPPVSKTTRPTTGTAPRPASASTRPATANTAKSSPSTAKPATPKTTATTPKTTTPRTTSTTPSAGRTPISQPSKTATPAKKDVTKPTTPAAKKPAAAATPRPSPAAKSTKPETPRSASKPDAKKPAASKPADTKTPTRPKTESRPTPSKTPGAKPAATKTASPKKTVGSSTPTPVKRGPKPVAADEQTESNKKTEEKEAVTAAATVAAAAAIASAAAAMVCSEEPAVKEVELVSPVAEVAPEPASIPQLSAQLDLVNLGEPANDSISPLGTTVMSPPCSPPGPMSPVREPQNASPLLDAYVQPDPYNQMQPLASSNVALHSPMRDEITFQEKEDDEEEDEEEKETLLMPTSKAPSADAFNMAAQPDLLGSCPIDSFTSGSPISPQWKEEAVEKADEEINEDDDEDVDDYEDEEQRRLGHQPSSTFTDMSGSQPSEEFPIKSSGFGSSAGWHGEDLLSGMDSEDVSSSTSSRQQGVSDLSSTQHTALLEGTQSSDALVDSSYRGSEGDGNFMGSPNVETLANEEEDDEDEEERVDDMDVSSERVEEHHKVFQQQGQEEEEDEDVEMPSEGVTESGLESCGNADEDDFNEEERLDNLNRCILPNVPPSSAWGQSNPFSDPWAQPSLLSASSPSPLSDHGAADPETPTQSPAQAWLDSSAPSLAPQSERETYGQQSAHEEMEASAPPAAPAVAMSQSSTLSGTALAAHSSSETSTPEELRDYDSSSGVESRSDKQQTPVPSSLEPDMEQDQGIHLERGDGEEEEAETLPADEVLGAGPPTAPASAPSSPSTSGDEASDTEGEMQINDPDAPMIMDDSAGFDSPPPTRNLPALDEDEEVVEAPAGEGEEDGGGTTPQSANSVASYGFDCTTSNSNPHSTAESCGKSPGIFSLENEDQLTEEAKDPSLIKELTLPSAAAAQSEDLLGLPVNLMPLGHPGDAQAGLDDHHYMMGGKMSAGDLEEVDPLEPSLHLGAQHAEDASDGQPPYYSAICDKTDSFLAGNV